MRFGRARGSAQRTIFPRRRSVSLCRPTIEPRNRAQNRLFLESKGHGEAPGRLHRSPAASCAARQAHEFASRGAPEFADVELQNPRYEEQLVIGDAPPSQLDLGDHRSLHIPTDQLQVSREVRLRPAFCFARLTEHEAEHVALRRVSSWRWTCHFWHSTVGLHRRIYGCHYWHFRNVPRNSSPAIRR